MLFVRLQQKYVEKMIVELYRYVVLYMKLLLRVLVVWLDEIRVVARLHCLIVRHTET